MNLEARIHMCMNIYDSSKLYITLNSMLSSNPKPSHALRISCYFLAIVKVHEVLIEHVTFMPPIFYGTKIIS